MSGKESTWTISTKVLIFCIVFLLLCQAATASDQVKIDFSPSEIQVLEDEGFSIQISIDTESKVSGAEMELSYDPSLLAITSVLEGDFFKQAGRSTIFSGGNIDNEHGAVTDIYCIMMGNNMFLEPGTFATIHIMPKGNKGTSVIEMKNIIVTNSAGQSLPLTYDSAKVTVENVNTFEEEEKGTKKAGYNSALLLLSAIFCMQILKRMLR